MADWDETTDVIVVGSGGGGMTAALTAKESGNDVLILEKSAWYGGSTAMSGGVIWAPDNYLMAEQGIKDTCEDALKYLKTITKGIVPDSRLKAYVNNASKMVDYLKQHSHVKFRIVTGYSDYYPKIDGCRIEGGRTIEPLPFDAGRLKKMRD